MGWARGCTASCMVRSTEAVNSVTVGSFVSAARYSCAGCCYCWLVSSSSCCLSSSSFLPITWIVGHLLPRHLSLCPAQSGAYQGEAPLLHGEWQCLSSHTSQLASTQLGSSSWLLLDVRVTSHSWERAFSSFANYALLWGSHQPYLCSWWISSWLIARCTSVAVHSRLLPY